MVLAHYSLLKGVCKDAKPEGRIAAGFQTRGNQNEATNSVCKDAERQPLITVSYEQ